MGAAAAVDGAAGAPAVEPVATPASPPTPESTPQGAGTEPAGTPSSTPQAAEEPSFPWRDYRKLRSQAEQLQGQVEHERQQRTALAAERQAWQAERAQLQQRAADYDALAGAINKNPELAEQLEQYLRSGAGTAREKAAQVGLPAEFLKEWQEDRKILRQLHEREERRDQLHQQSIQQQELTEVGRQLDIALTKQLKDKDYDEALLPVVRSFVLARIRELGGAEPEEVPYLFNEWYRLAEGSFQARMKKLTEGKLQDQKTLPPSVPAGGTGPVTGKVDMGALDGKTARHLEKQLLQRGWGRTPS